MFYFFFTLRNVRTMNVPSLSVWWKNRRRESTTLTQHYNDDAHCHPTNKNLLNENCCSTSASYCSYLSRPKVSQRNLSNASNGQTGKLLTTAEMCVCVCVLYVPFECTSGNEGRRHDRFFHYLFYRWLTRR